LNQPTHTIPSREEILGIFRSAKGPLDLRALSKSLKVATDAQAVLSRRLNAMARSPSMTPANTRWRRRPASSPAASAATVTVSAL